MTLPIDWRVQALSGPSPPTPQPPLGASPWRGFRRQQSACAAAGSLGFGPFRLGRCWVYCGWSWLVFSSLLFVGAWWLRGTPGNSDLPMLALMITFLAAMGSCFAVSMVALLDKHLSRHCADQEQQQAIVVSTVWGFASPAGFAPLVRGWGAVVFGLAILAVIAVIIDALFWTATGATSPATAGISPERPFHVASWVWGVQAGMLLMPIRGGMWRTHWRQTLYQWQQHRRGRRAVQQEHSEAADAEEVDSILAKLHQHGLKSLSAAERRVLRRVSERLRQDRDGRQVDSYEDGDTSR